METISNIATTATSTVSSLIYGQPTKDKETVGEEPLSGQQGQGTATEPFDQGNAETQAATSKSDTKSDEFLKLNPTVGSKSTTDSSTTETKTGASGDAGLPIIPLNPESSVLASDKKTTSDTQTGSTDKANVTDKEWKPTAIDEIKPAGAPGAGPSAPEFTAATPETSQGTSAPTTDAEEKTTEDKKVVDKKAEEKKAEASTDALLKTASPEEKTVDDSEADNPHSKMSGKTIRHTEPAKTGTDGQAKSAVEESAGQQTESSKSGERSSSTGGEEKTGKISLKEKLKGKLHIGSKDK